MAKLNAVYAQIKPTLSDSEPKMHSDPDGGTAGDAPEPFYGPADLGQLVKDAGPGFLIKGIEPMGPLLAMSRTMQDCVHAITASGNVDDDTVKAMMASLRDVLIRDNAKSQDIYGTSIKRAFVVLFRYAAPDAKAAQKAIGDFMLMALERHADPAALVDANLAALDSVKKASGGAIDDDIVQLVVDGASRALLLHRDPVQTGLALAASAKAHPSVTLNFEKQMAEDPDAKMTGSAYRSAILFGKDPAPVIAAGRAALKANKDPDDAIQTALGLTMEQLEQAGYANVAD